jgi:hypothetical protein
MQLMDGAVVPLWVGPVHPFNSAIKMDLMDDSVPCVHDINEAIRELEGPTYPWPDF